MKTIYFIRHGESEANAAGVAAGGGMDAILTEHGRHQAKKLGEMFKGKGVELIVSSPLKRARETANIIAQDIGIEPDEVIVNTFFAERHLGELTGAPKEKMKIYYDAGVLPASVETTESVHRRVVEGLEWLKTLDSQKIALVSHGGVGRMVRAILREEHHGQINSLSRMGNSELFEFKI